jgi:prolycopene isomerase
MEKESIQTDIAVIGSGLGGLTAAALLAKRGLRVTVIEQHFQPGGSCGAFRRQDRTFDQGTAMLYGFGSRGFNPHRFVMNELDEPIDIIKHEHLYRVIYDGHPITFCADIDLFMEQLEQLFPRDIRGIRAFYRYMEDLYLNVITAEPICTAPSEIPAAEGRKLFLRHPVRNLKLFRLFEKSAGDLLRRFVRSEEVARFFSKLTSTYCYTTMDETPAILAVTMFMDNHYGGSYYPAGGTQQLPGKLEKALERRGGSVLYSTRALELIFSQGKPAGVLARKHTPWGEPDALVQISADQIIYGGTLRQLHTRLIPEEHRSPGELERIEALAMTYPSVVIYAAVDETVIPEGTLPIEMFADNPEKIDEKEVTAYIFSLADPSICPRGEHLVTAIGPQLDSWPSPDDPQYRSPAYAAAKERETERLLSILESHFPGFRTGLRYSTLATPTTIERYTLKEHGCVAGPKQQMGQDLLRRQHASTRWDSLFICGESTVMGTGSPAVTISGISAANMVLRTRGLEEYRHRVHAEDRVTLFQVSGPPLRSDSSGRIIPARNAIGEEESEKILLHDRASRCLWCEDAPCTAVCPAELDIRGIMRRLEAGNVLGAQRQLDRDIVGYRQKEDRPAEQDLPCSRCSGACEQVCRRRDYDRRPVKIRKVLALLSGPAAEKQTAQ